ncbi:polysaccharide lyase 8 family protein [Curtobacterium sp. RRHDQ10]|uniref:polysaccharide lyase 8 family protein n=1 Tax=Curtobacterium phyllosphaerae TaxID=3413379 RepID=UPI003BF017AE
MQRNEAHSSGPSRRTVLQVGAAAIGGLAAASTVGLGPIGAAVAATTPTVYDRIRANWLATLVGSVDTSVAVVADYVKAAAATAQTLRNSLDTSSDRTYLWADLDSSTISAVQTTAIGRIRTLALALKTPGSTLYQDADLSDDIVSAVEWFLAHKYGGTVAKYNNWWDFEIGIPLALNDVCVLMFDELGTTDVATAMAAIKKYAPDPDITNGGTSTGANRNWACSIAIVRGALSGDSTLLSTAKTAYSKLFAYSTSGDGFYPDGGFIQHDHYAYTGAYGVSLLQYITYSMLAVQGTTYAFSSNAVSLVTTWVQQNYRPWLYRGEMMDMVRGRALSRFYETDARTGRLVIATLAQLTAVLPTADAATLKAQIKGWIAAATFQPFFTYDPAPVEQVRIPSIVRGHGIDTANTVTAVGESTASVIATSMARAVHRRPGFAFGIAMDTATIHPYESENQENLLGWYTGEGAVYLYLPASNGHWANEYWPTASKYHIPGTTVESVHVASGASRRSSNTWAGGVVQGDVTAVGMGLAPTNEDLRAKKSWFCLADTIVALGAGITASDGNDVITFIESRNIGPNGSTTPVIDGSTVLTTPDSTPTTFTPDWVHIPGVGGYVFPSTTTVQATRADQSGYWTSMDNRGTYEDDTEHTRRFITLAIDHGTDPTNKSYAYFQLPAATQAQTSAAAASDDITVLSNTADVQTVRQASTGVTATNVWVSGQPAVGGISIDKTGCVVVRNSGGTLTVAVSDPTQALTGQVTVTLDTSASSLTAKDDGVTVVSTSPVTLRIDVDGADGGTFTATFTM